MFAYLKQSTYLPFGNLDIASWMLIILTAEKDSKLFAY